MYEAIGEGSKEQYVIAETPELVHQRLLENYPSELPGKVEYSQKTRTPTKVLPEPMRIRKIK